MNKYLTVGLNFIIPSLMVIAASPAQGFTLSGSLYNYEEDDTKVDYWLTDLGARFSLTSKSTPALIWQTCEDCS